MRSFVVLAAVAMAAMVALAAPAMAAEEESVQARAMSSMTTSFLELAVSAGARGKGTVCGRMRCAYDNAVCCTDGVHCCPSEYSCDAKGKCTKVAKASAAAAAAAAKPVAARQVVLSPEINVNQNTGADAPVTAPGKLDKVRQNIIIVKNINVLTKGYAPRGDAAAPVPVPAGGAALSS